jgi:hypothetical protein
MITFPAVCPDCGKTHVLTVLHAALTAGAEVRTLRGPGVLVRQRETDGWYEVQLEGGVTAFPQIWVALEEVRTEAQQDAIEQPKPQEPF